MQSWTWRIICIGFLTIWSGSYLVPSFFPVSKWISEAKMKLGLDLQGGMHIVMSIKPNEVVLENLKRDKISFEERLKEKEILIETTSFNLETESDPKFVINFSDAGIKIKTKEFFNSDYSTVFRITKEEDKLLEFGYQRSRVDYILENGIDQALQVIRNRIDEFGVSEPTIQKAGNDRIAIQLPGLKDPERAKGLIGQTAKLNFQIVSSDMTPGDVEKIVADFESKDPKNKSDNFKTFADFVSAVNEFAKDKLPKDTEIAFQREDKKASAIQGRTVSTNIPYLLKSKVELSGEDLKDAFVTINQETNLPSVSLSFNPAGAIKFGDVTGANVNKQMAIVLDGVVHSAPNTNERIGDGSAIISLGYGDYNTVLSEAKDITIVLRAGSLPVKLHLSEERLVGPSLGKDSIEAGKKATLVGALLVVVFMFIYYGVGGFIADLALGLNILFLLALMVGIESTLTMPGIAGLALTIGMAVDGNILIFERIREEMRAGKSNEAAVRLGFSRAFETIIDSNLTTAITGILLYIFGTGPIQGFAVTLLIGILTTLFTNTFVSRTFFDCYLKFNPKKLSV